MKASASGVRSARSEDALHGAGANAEFAGNLQDAVAFGTDRGLYARPKWPIRSYPVATASTSQPHAAGHRSSWRPTANGSSGGHLEPSFDRVPWGQGCKFARNTDPLRGDFASNSDPS